MPPGSAVYIDIDTLDLTDRSAVETYMRSGDFSHVIELRGLPPLTRPKKDKMQCSVANVDAVSISYAWPMNGFKISRISTDYVFDGEILVAIAKSTNRSLFRYTVLQSALCPAILIVLSSYLIQRYNKNPLMQYRRAQIRYINKEKIA